MGTEIVRYISIGAGVIVAALTGFTVIFGVTYRKEIWKAEKRRAAENRERFQGRYTPGHKDHEVEREVANVGG